MSISRQMSGMLCIIGHTMIKQFKDGSQLSLLALVKQRGKGHENLCLTFEAL